MTNIYTELLANAVLEDLKSLNLFRTVARAFPTVEQLSEYSDTQLPALFMLVEFPEPINQQGLYRLNIDLFYIQNEADFSDERLSEVANAINQKLLENPTRHQQCHRILLPSFKKIYEPGYSGFHVYFAYEYSNQTGSL